MIRAFQKEYLANRYKVLNLIGKGTTSYIYKAYDTKIKKLVAIKCLPEFNYQDVLILKREFRNISDWSHNNLVEFYDLYIQEQTIFFTMEWINGFSYYHSIWGRDFFCNKSADYNFLREIFIQLTKGIQFLHSLGILHRDIKPDNIMVDSKRAILIDFGLSRNFFKYIPEWDNLAEIDGTFAYMPPEVLKGKAPSTASDWYSLGVVLYESLTGKLPDVILGFDPTPPISLVPDIPEDLNEITLQLLYRDENKRPSGHEIVKKLKSSFSFLDFAASDYPTNSIYSKKNRDFFF
ncbi:MAG: serine/threonine protein kinase [Desulfobacterales bacterium]|nr:serine/threonine protein kinase [Desulfobacterales bacterium]